MADKGINYDRDSDYMLSAIDDENVDKILIAARYQTDHGVSVTN